jgi:hypothetical protein
MKKLVLIAFLGLGISYIGKAQAPGFGDDTEDTNPNNNAPGFNDDVDDVPLDGGIGLLVAAGAAYGYKRFHKNNRQLNKKNA